MRKNLAAFALGALVLASASLALARPSTVASPPPKSVYFSCKSELKKKVVSGRVCAKNEGLAIDRCADELCDLDAICGGHCLCTLTSETCVEPKR